MSMKRIKSWKNFKRGVDQLKPGFIVITDITEYAPPSEEVRLILVTGTQHAVERGMSRLIRIVTDSVTSNIGTIQFNRGARELGYIADEMKSLDEAMKLTG